jgi:beta-phosphoglucomutase-like phosphatase (HAD superfamily)
MKLEKPKLKVKGIVLDLDGTIVDSRQAHVEAAKTGLTGKQIQWLLYIQKLQQRKWLNTC